MRTTDDLLSQPSSPVTPSEWAEITDLFGEALELSLDARPEFVAALRSRAPKLAREVESLLGQHERPGDFLPEFPQHSIPSADLSGRTLGQYRLLSLLGAGGMGAVYLAERSDGAFAKQVAIKLLAPGLAHARDRFQRERELLARLDHPNIARLLDGGTTPDGSPYLVMEYVAGLPIDRYCRERVLSIDDRVGLLVQVCAGLVHAHQQLVVHCDIKPENILVTSDGTVKLLDFGIARLLSRPQQTQFRAATPAFSSPEQMRGDPLTTASDVYATGVLGYVLFTDRWPYPGSSSDMIEAVHAVVTTEPVLASRVSGLAPSHARKLRGDLDNILAKAVAKEPHRRYASAQQLADDLEAFRRGFPVRARPDTLAYRTRRFIGRHRVATLASSASVLTLLAAVTVSTWQARIAERRFNDLREFAHTIVFDVDQLLGTVAGTTAARKLVVETALRYLDKLGSERSTDLTLREELAATYIRVAKVQGSSFLPNLGDVKGAISSFNKAIATVGPTPSTAALERLRIEAHINMALLAPHPMAGAADFDRAIEAGERLRASNPDDIAALRLIGEAYHGKATIAHLINHVPDHLHAVQRAIDVRERVLGLSPGHWRDRIDLAREHSQHALALMQLTDAEAALLTLRRVRTLVEDVHRDAPSNQVVIRELAAARSRAAWVLGVLGRYVEADAEIAAAVALLSPAVASDPSNRQYASELMTAWWRLGDIRRAEGRLHEALALHRRALEFRREGAKRDSSFMFVPWGLSMSLNAVGEVLMALSPDNWRDAEKHFAEARDLIEPLLSRAPTFNQLRRELAISHEGLARVALARHETASPQVRDALEKSVATWREAFARSVGDRRQTARLAELEALLASFGAAEQ